MRRRVAGESGRESEAGSVALPGRLPREAQQPIEADCPIQMVATSGRDELHGVVDGHASRDHTAGAVDEVDVPLRVFRLQEEKLSNNHVRELVLDAASNEDDAGLEQPGVDVPGAFSSVGDSKQQGQGSSGMYQDRGALCVPVGILV